MFDKSSFNLISFVTTNNGHSQTAGVGFSYTPITLYKSYLNTVDKVSDDQKVSKFGSQTPGVGIVKRERFKVEQFVSSFQKVIDST